MLEILLEPRFMRVLGWILFFLSPLAAAGWWYRTDKRARRFRRFLYLVLMLALSGPVLVLLWHLQRGVLALMGLDSAPALLASMLLFAGIGSGAGYLFRMVLQMPGMDETNETRAADGTGGREPM